MTSLVKSQVAERHLKRTNTAGFATENDLSTRLSSRCLGIAQLRTSKGRRRDPKYMTLISNIFIKIRKSGSRQAPSFEKAA
uniref:Uncharacterized protein n=1 Tax=Vespula pensylvanica TaxID=30213 RepID=A0A834NJS9_VESPE|nr:hypothetical protein H0235_012606 [Vespula pensylvanica]